MKPSTVRGTSAGRRAKSPLKIKGSAALALDQLRVAFHQSGSNEKRDDLTAATGGGGGGGVREEEGISREIFCSAIVKFFPELLLLWRKTAKPQESEDPLQTLVEKPLVCAEEQEGVDLDEIANRLFLNIDRYQTGRVTWDAFLEAVVEYVCASLDTLEYDNRLYVKTRSVSNLRCAEKLFPLQYHHELFAVSLRTQPLTLMCRSTLQVMKQFQREELGMHRSPMEAQSALYGATSAASTAATAAAATTAMKKGASYGEEPAALHPKMYSQTTPATTANPAAISVGSSSDGSGGYHGGGGVSNRQTVKPIFVEYLPAPDLLVSYGDDRCIRAWLGASAPSIIENLAPVDCQGIVRRLRIRPDVFSHSVFTVDTHGYVNRWDVSVQRPHGAFSLAASYKLHDEMDGGAVDFCIGPAHIFSAGYDGNLLATAFDTGRTAIVGNRSPSIRLLEYSDLCACVVSVGFDNRVVYWDPYTQSSIPGITFTNRDFPDDCFIEELYCATDLPHVFTRDAQGTIKVWDLHTLNCIQAIAPSDTEARHSSNVASTTASSSSSHKTIPLPAATSSSPQALQTEISPQFPLSKSRQLSFSRTIGYFPSTREIIECVGNGMTCYGFDHNPEPTTADTQVINWALYCATDDTFILQGSTRTSVWSAEGGWWKRCVDRTSNLDLSSEHYEVQAICMDQEEGILYLSPFNSKGRIELYSTRTLTLMDTRSPHPADVTQLVFCPTRRVLVTGHVDGVVVLVRTAEFGVMFVSSVHASSFPVREMAVAESLGIVVVVDERQYLNVVDILAATVTPRCSKALQPIGKTQFCGELPLLAVRHTVGTVSLLLVRQPTHANPTASVTPLMTLDLVSGPSACCLRSTPAFDDCLNLSSKSPGHKNKSFASSRSLGSRSPSPRRHSSSSRPHTERHRSAHAVVRSTVDFESCATEVQSRVTSASNGILKQRPRVPDAGIDSTMERTSSPHLGATGSGALTLSRGRLSFVGKPPSHSPFRQIDGVSREASRHAMGESATATPSLVGAATHEEDDILQVARRSKECDACAMDFDPVSNTLFLGDSKGFVHTWDFSTLIDELDFWNAPSVKDSFSANPPSTDSTDAAGTSASPAGAPQTGQHATASTSSAPSVSTRTRTIKRWREEAAAALTAKYGYFSRATEESESAKPMFRVLDSARGANENVDVVQRVSAASDVHNGYEVRTLSWCSAANMLLSSGEDRRVVLLDACGTYLAELASGRLPRSLSSQLSSTINNRCNSSLPYPTMFTQRNALSTQEYVLLPAYSLDQHRRAIGSASPARADKDEPATGMLSGETIEVPASHNASRSGNPADNGLNINTSFAHSCSSPTSSSSGGVASSGPSSPQSNSSRDHTTFRDSLRQPVPSVKRSPRSAREIASADARTLCTPPPASSPWCDEGEKLLHGDPQPWRWLPEMQQQKAKKPNGDADNVSLDSTSSLSGRTTERSRTLAPLPLTPDKPWLRHHQLTQAPKPPAQPAHIKISTQQNSSNNNPSNHSNSTTAGRPYSAATLGSTLSFDSIVPLSYPCSSSSTTTITTNLHKGFDSRGTKATKQTVSTTPRGAFSKTATVRPNTRTLHHPRLALTGATASPASRSAAVRQNNTSSVISGNTGPAETFGKVRDHEEHKRIGAFEKRLQTCLRGGDLSLSSRESRGVEVLKLSDAFRTLDYEYDT